MKLEIRYARPGDKEAILRLMKPYNMHQVPSPEMPELDTRFFYVAEADGKPVGAAGFTFISPETGKTTLLAVAPGFTSKGIGLALQAKRLAAMKSLGCEKVITNADRPETIAWYQRHFGYREVGTLKKIHSFGREDIDHWTTLECDLEGVNPEKYLPPPAVPPLIINCALTGCVHLPGDSPYLPLTPERIAADAEQAAKLGATIMHLHARDKEGKPTLDPKLSADLFKRVRDRCPEVIICGTTSGRHGEDVTARAAVLELEGDAKPEMATLTLGSMNFPRRPSVNSPDTIRRLASAMIERGIKPETETFDLGMLDYARHLIQEGYLLLPIYCNTFLGSLGTLAARPANAEIMRQAVPIDTCWAVAGVGRYQRPMVEWAIKAGAHVRVGLEDNLYHHGEKRVFARNAELVEIAVKTARAAGRRVATPAEARRLIGL